MTFTASGVTYTPAANYNGPDSFTYTITDNGTTNGVARLQERHGHRSTSRSPRSTTAPIAVNDSTTVAEDGSVTFDPRTNDSHRSGQRVEPDPDGHAPSTQGAHGTVTFTASGVTYTPAANYNGPDSFTYTITDNGTTNGVARPQERHGHRQRHGHRGQRHAGRQHRRCESCLDRRKQFDDRDCDVQ